MTPLRPFAVLTLAVLMLVSGCDEDGEDAAGKDQATQEKRDAKAKKQEAKADRKKNFRALAYHVKNLKDKDSNVRENSAEMLGLIAAPDAVPDLIEALGDKVLMVQLKAHAALIKITGKNFDYREQKQWREWWKKDGEECREKGTPDPEYRMAICGYRVEP